MPFKVPDGYFDRVQLRAMNTARGKDTGQRSGLSRRLLRITTAAAMLAAAVTGGLSITRNRTLYEEQMLDEAFFYAELMPNDTGILYGEDSYGYIADSDISDEDIIDYLIYSGIPVEQLNESDYE